jgi:hypothetical protein
MEITPPVEDIDLSTHPPDPEKQKALKAAQEARKNFDETERILRIKMGRRKFVSAILIGGLATVAGIVTKGAISSAEDQEFAELNQRYKTDIVRGQHLVYNKVGWWVDDNPYNLISPLRERRNEETGEKELQIRMTTFDPINKDNHYPTRWVSKDDPLLKIIPVEPQK